MHLVNCGSLLKLELQGTVPLGSLLYYVLRSKGIHIGEHRPFFFTTAHTEDDLARILAIFKESVWELQQAGFLPPSEAGPAHESSYGTHVSQVAPLPGARLGRDPQGQPGWYVPDDTRPGKYLKIEAVAPSPAGEPGVENGGA